VIFVPPYYLKSFLVNYSAASVANIETSPVATLIWRRFVSVFITGFKAIAVGFIAANTNPRLITSSFVGNVLFFIHIESIHPAQRWGKCAFASIKRVLTHSSSRIVADRLSVGGSLLQRSIPDMTIYDCLYRSRSEEWPTLRISSSGSIANSTSQSIPAQRPKMQSASFNSPNRTRGSAKTGAGTESSAIRRMARPCVGGRANVSRLRGPERRSCCSRAHRHALVPWVYGKAAAIRFVRGRLKFGDGTQSAPFPSLVAIDRPPAAR
jgi:hypothetical protein